LAEVVFSSLYINISFSMSNLYKMVEIILTSSHGLNSIFNN